MFQINKERPGLIGNTGLYLDPGVVAAVERSYRRFADLGGMHIDVKRYNGQIGFQGSPFYAYTNEAQIADVIRGMTEDGAMVANNHTFIGRRNGVIAALDGEANFKRQMDPYGLMNPGKAASEAPAPEANATAGAALPTTGWDYESRKSSPLAVQA